MKRIWMVLAAFMLVALAACGAKENVPSVEEPVNVSAQESPSEVFVAGHQECSVVAEEEMRSDARPELSTHVEDMDEYNIVYVGYPIWWYMEPMAIRTFLEEYDFTGKTVIPFCTTLGAGIGESEENIAALADGATVLEGVTLRTGREDMSEEITSWLTEIGMLD